MPATPRLIVEDSTGSERFRLTAKYAERTDSLVEMWTATATVDRDDWLAVRGQVDEVNDRVRIERGDGTTFFEGRFRTDERDGNTINVVVASYEQDAADAEPTDALEIFQNVDDDAVFTDAINSVGTLLTGTVETGASGVSFSFAHAARSKQVRDAAEPAGMDVRYNFDRTVDFVQRLGSDKSGSITVSSTAQNIVDTLEVEENSRDPVTHVRGLGAQQGDEQVSAETVIPSYSAGDRQVWRKYVNKDIVNEDRLQEIVDRLASEYDTARRRIKIEAGLVGVDVSLGDSVTVDLPDHDISRSLRIVRLTEILSETAKKIVTLTNREPERGGDRKRRDDLKRFNEGWQGFVDRDNDSYGWQPVTSSQNATRPYEYPDDVVSEKVAKVIVNSIPYRAYSQGAASGGDHTHTVDVTHPSHDHDVTHPSHTHDVTHPQHDHDVTVTHPSHNHSISATSTNNTEFSNTFKLGSSGQSISMTDTYSDIDTISPTQSTSIVYIVISVTNNTSSGVFYRGRISDNADFIPNSFGAIVFAEGGETTTMVIPYAKDASNTPSDPTLQMRTDTTATASTTLTYDWMGVGLHTHDVSDTSTAALGTTETSTSDTALGTNETSTAALGTTETSTAALGTTETSTAALGTTTAETSDASGPHTHDPKPGLIDFPTETASGVDLIVNGTTVATNIGSGTFTAEVDISGELNAGNNTIEAASDTLGLLNLTVVTQLFRQGSP